MQDILSSPNQSTVTSAICSTTDVKVDWSGFIDYVISERTHQLPPIERASTAERVLRLLELTRFRRGKAAYIPTDDMINTIQDAVADKEPIQFRLLGFAGKLQNHRCSHQNPDLGDYWALASLEALANAIQHIHPPGATIHVYSDATTYPPIFYEDLQPMNAYHDELERFAQQLPSVSFHDLTAHLPDNLWARCSQHVRTLQRNHYTETNEFRNLRDNAIYLVHSDDLDRDANQDIVRRRARQAALRYKAMKHVIRDTELPPQGSIRMTTHPKPGQYGFQLINRDSYNYPWNGVAYIKANDELRIYDEPKSKHKAQTSLRRGDELLAYTARQEESYLTNTIRRGTPTGEDRPNARSI